MLTSSPELLEKAWSLPVARLYAPLLSQSFRSICGPTSVANVLRSMRLPTGKNPFRRFGLRPMSLDQIVGESSEVLPPTWTVTAVRPRTLDELRAELPRFNDARYRFIANFSRVPIFGGGGGHHSPIGGWLEAEDLVFVLDVNARYGPWLVRSERLFEAMSIRGLARYCSAAASNAT